MARFIAAALYEPRAAPLRPCGSPELAAELRAAADGLGIATLLVDAVFAALADDDGTRSILGHTVRSECPPYELEYRSAEVFQQSQTLADISGFYRAFGLEVAGTSRERVDHASAEWEFLATMAMMEFLAADDEQRGCCRDAQRAFLAEHAAGWMPAFFERIRKADGPSFLARVADLADVVLRQWCEQLEVPLGPRWLELRPVGDDDLTISCGAPGAVELGPRLSAALEEVD